MKKCKAVQFIENRKCFSVMIIFQSTILKIRADASGKPKDCFKHFFKLEELWQAFF